MDEEARFLVIGGLAFATGLLVGVGTGLLLAPQSGARTRRQLSNLAEDVREEATATAQETKEMVNEAIDGVIERGKRLVQ